MRLSTLVACILFTAVVSTADEIDYKHLQCLVCRSTIEELENALSKVKQNIDIGNHRLDDKGNWIKKQIPLAHSEVYLSEVLDNICEKMGDYVRATYKSNGRLTILNLVTPEGGMNPEMSQVDIIQDGDLNKSLKYYCEEIVAEHEEQIIELFRKKESDIINKVCTQATKICDESIPSDEDDSVYEDDDLMDKTEL